MSNPFKEIIEQKEVPEELKGRVMSSIYLGKFIADLADLFTVKYIETIGGLFKTSVSEKPDLKSDDSNENQNVK